MATLCQDIEHTLGWVYPSGRPRMEEISSAWCQKQDFLIHPPFNEDDDKERCHHKIEPFRVELEKRAKNTAKCCANDPIGMIQHCHEKHEPSLVYIFRRSNSAIDRK